MYLLSITKIKYPKNDTIVLEFSNYDSMSKEIKRLLDNNIISKNNIIRIEVNENE